MKSTLTARDRWELASFDSEATHRPVSARGEPVPPPSTFSEEEIAVLRDAARREGYEAGHAEGYAAGHLEGLSKGEREAREKGEAAVAPLLAAAQGIEEKLGAIDQSVADELVALAVELARSVIRQSIAAQPETLVALVREALLQLPTQHAAIHLHPEDASLVRSFAGDQLTHAGHRILEDSKLTRGDAVIDCGGSHLDATVSTRWRRVLEGIGRDTPWQTEPPTR